jgi:uncharacterized membrane protein
MPQPTAILASRRWLKPALWTVMGLMTISVTGYTELPFLFTTLPWPHDANSHVHLTLFLLLPHIIAGTFALIIGPFQFSSRLRSRNLQLHRLLGRVYVYSVFIAATLGIILAVGGVSGRKIFFAIAIATQAITWIITTAAALITARNRQIQQHREWMVRSYAVTFTFVATRFLKPIPAWNHIGPNGLPMVLIIATLLAILVPDIALHWRELTTRRS